MESEAPRRKISNKISSFKEMWNHFTFTDIYMEGISEVKRGKEIEKKKR
jgi:hypothetical protein